MTKTQKILVGYSALSVVVITAACTGGTGAPGSVALGYENRKGDYAEPTEDGQDPPPSGQPRQGQGGSSGQTPTPTVPVPVPTPTTTTTSPPQNCPPCDGKYTCTTTSGQSVVFDLQQVTGQCTEVASKAVLTCDGKVKIAGQPDGQWAASGGRIVVQAGGITYSCAKGTAIVDAGRDG